MKTFHELTLDNGVPTPAGERAMELVYEALTGECWHGEGLIRCPKCGAYDGFQIDPDGSPCNLALLTSLDAWRPLWERMSQDHKLTNRFRDKLERYAPLNFWLAQPHHHLEVALRTLEVECPDCGGEGRIDITHEQSSYHRGNIGKHYKSCTCTNGKIPLWDIWEAGNA